MEENYKNCWRGANFQPQDKSDKVNRRTTALQSLADRYKRFAIVGFMSASCFPICLRMMLKDSPEAVGEHTTGLIILFAVYFLMASFMDLWLYRGISAIDVSKMPVAEVCRLAFYYRKKHLQFICILLPICFAIIGCLAWTVDSDAYFYLFSGAVCGFAVGIRQLILFMRSYREIMKE